MANVTAPYDPIWYAQKFIQRLETRLTFVRTFSRAFDETAREKGSVIEFKKPGGFTATNMPVARGSEQDLDPTKDNIRLDQWKGVQFGINDKELAYTGEEIIRHHVDPAVQAVAEAIEASAVALYADIPWHVTSAGTLADFVNVRKALNDRKVPMTQRSLGLNYEREATYLGLDLFASAEKSAEGASTQREGFLGRKMGLDTFTAPMLGNHTPGTTMTGVPLLQGAHVKGATIVNIDGITAGNLAKGDTLVIAGNAQRYAVTATSSAGAAQAVQVFPPLVQAYADNAAVTVRQQAAGINVGYHSEAFALVMAPLSEAGNGRGAEIGVAIDDQTGLAIRVSRWYDGYDKKHLLSFDALWGVKTVDSDKAVRLEGPTL